MPRLCKRLIVLSRLENGRRMQIPRASAVYRNNEQTHDESRANRKRGAEIRAHC